EFVDARVAVAVAHVDVTARRKRRVRAAVEGRAAHVGRRLPRHAKLEQHLALGGALPHHVPAVVGAVEDVVRVDVQPVRARKGSLAPRADEVALAVEHDHRVLAAVEYVDPVLAVHRDGGDVLEFPALGQLRPVLEHAIPMVSATEDHWWPMLKSLRPLRSLPFTSHSGRRAKFTGTPLLPSTGRRSRSNTEVEGM